MKTIQGARCMYRNKNRHSTDAGYTLYQWARRYLRKYGQVKGMKK